MKDRLRQLGPNDRQIPRRTFNGLVRLGNALQSITGPNVAAGPLGVRIGEGRPRINQVVPSTGLRIYDAKLTGWETEPEPLHRWFTGRRIDAEGNEIDPEDINIYCLTYPDRDGDLEWHFPQPAIEGVREGSNNVIEVRQVMAEIQGELKLSWWATGWFQFMCPPGGGQNLFASPTAGTSRRISIAKAFVRSGLDRVPDDAILAGIEEQQRRLTGGRGCCD